MPDRMREHIHDKMLTWRPSGPHTVGPQARGPAGPRRARGAQRDEDHRDRRAPQSWKGESPRATRDTHQWEDDHSRSEANQQTS